MNRISKQAVDKNGKTIREQWVHATVWIVGPVTSLMLSYAIGLLIFRLLVN